MTYRPTVIGQPRAVDPPAAPVVQQTFAPSPAPLSEFQELLIRPQSENLPVPVMQTALVPISDADLLATVPVTLSAEQARLVIERVRPLDITKIPQMQIAQMGSDADRALGAVLDGFLSKVDRGNDPALFTLFGKVGKAVDDAKLNELADKILDGKGSWTDRALGMFTRKSPLELLQKAHEEVTAMLKEKTGTLKDVVDKTANELGPKLAGLQAEMENLEQLKRAYGERIVDFTLATALTRVFVEMSRPVVARAEAELAATQNPTPEAQMFVEELRSRLETAENVALNREATLTRLPADQEVIRQIQQAGISTYIETLVTAGARFNSIKMTLLKLHGANIVRGVQALNAQGAALDKNLGTVSRKLTKQIATTSANAAGDNRVAQAQQIQLIVTECAELKTIAADGRKNNAAKFAQVRGMLADSRKELVALGNVKEVK